VLLQFNRAAHVLFKFLLINSAHMITAANSQLIIARLVKLRLFSKLFERYKQF
jgi:hypothetical protein